MVWVISCILLGACPPVGIIFLLGVFAFECISKKV